MSKRKASTSLVRASSKELSFNAGSNYSNWQFTLNNYRDTDPDDILDMVGSTLGYVAFTKEEAPSTGTPHLQGFFQLPERQKLSWIKKRVSRSAHFEPLRGTLAENLHYIQKPHPGCTCKDCAPIQGLVVQPQLFTRGDWVEGQQGRRNDLRDAYARLDAGATVSEVCREYPYAAGYMLHAWDRARKEFLEKKSADRSEVKVTWYFGGSGAGKTTRARSEADHLAKARGEPRYYLHTNADGWWGSYRGESVVVMDELRAGHIDLATMLRLFERGYVDVKVKGSEVPFCATRIFVTSNCCPHSFVPDREDARQLFRRISEIKFFPPADPSIYYCECQTYLKLTRQPVDQPADDWCAEHKQSRDTCSICHPEDAQEVQHFLKPRAPPPFYKCPMGYLTCPGTCKCQASP